MNKIWFIFKGTHHLGPFSVEEVEEFYLAKEINDKTMFWKEGTENWIPLYKIVDFNFLFKKETLLVDIPSGDDLPPPLPKFANLPSIPNDELPPTLPFDVFLQPIDTSNKDILVEDKKSQISKISLMVGGILFAIIIGWYSLSQKEAAVELRIKNLMPIYQDKLEMTASRDNSKFEVALALSLDGLTIWGSTNNPGEMFTTIKLESIPRKVLGTETIAVTVKGEFKNHLGKFSRMILSKGDKFLPGEYQYHVEARETHFLNRNFRSLSAIPFFKSLNKNYVFEGRTLIFAGTPREFEKRLSEYSINILGELLKPFQEKLEQIRTFESILNGTSQNYLMELDNAKTGKAISRFERKFMNEFAPLLQAMVLKAEELSRLPTKADLAPYKGQVQIGKQIGELASDMITKTIKFKKLAMKDKTELKADFDKRAKAIKLQIDMNVKILEDQIQKISK